MVPALVGMILAGPSLPAADALFTPETTVVSLSGLPGDVESERAYEGQLVRLLDILAAVPVRRVFVLADAPERVRTPPGLASRVLPSTRTDLLSLGSELAKGTGPVVIVAWGHAGLQGRTPVFHVRGPRVTPADFNALAVRLGAPSRWLLFFRGSGEFARALRAEGREVLASDNEVAFRSDPVGMDVLLGLLRDRPGLDLPALGDRLGPATAQWYAGQSLARTEEPTLWRGMEAPRILAADTRVAGDAVPRPSATPSPTMTPPNPSPAPVRPGAWLDIDAVEASRFPGAAAVVLRRSTRYALGRSPALVQEVDEFIQVLTDEGKHHGDFEITYSPPEERVTILDAEVLRPDGTLERLDAEAVRDAAPPLMPEGYAAPSRKVFSLPGVAPGAILRVHHRSEWQHFPLPEILLEVPLASPLPLVDSTLEVQAALESAFHYAFDDTPPREPAVERSTYGVTYRWRFQDVPALVPEVLSRPGRTPRLLVSTFSDWASFAAWYRRLIRQADTITPEIQSRAAELTRGARTPLDKVVAVYNYVTGLRYVAIPLGVNSHRPHAAANVLKNRYGDCKDKANLFNALLRSQGIPADLVLVPRFTQAHDDVPGAGFNHAISRVRVGDQVIWADTTDDVARFGLLPPGDPGRKVLVVDGATQALTTLPVPEPSAHRLVIEGTLGLDAEAAGPQPGTLQVRAAGYADYELRLAARLAAEQATTRPVLAETYRPAVGLFAMEGREQTPTGALDRDFTWSARGSWSGMIATLPGGGRLVRAPFWLPQEWDSALHPRTSPLHLNQGYPLTLDQRFTIALPPGAARLALPSARSSGEGPLRFVLRWSPATEGRVEAALRLELTRGELDLEGTRAFQRQLRALLAALGEGTTFALPPR